MIKWSEEDVIAAFQAAMDEADSMPSPQQMMAELMNQAQMQPQGMPE